MSLFQDNSKEFDINNEKIQIIDNNPYYVLPENTKIYFFLIVCGFASEFSFRATPWVPRGSLGLPRAPRGSFRLSHRGRKKLGET